MIKITMINSKILSIQHINGTYISYSPEQIQKLQQYIDKNNILPDKNNQIMIDPLLF